MASWIAVFVIEKYGRRKLMLFGSVGQTLSMIVLAVVNFLAAQNKATNGTNQGPGVAAVLFLFVFNTFFAVGWLGMVGHPVVQNSQRQQANISRHGCTPLKSCLYGSEQPQMLRQPQPIGCSTF